MAGMPVLREKWVQSPLAVIKDIFELEGGSDNVSDGDWGISQFFESKLNQQQEDSPMLVPCLTSISLPHLHNGCLVSYIGMVQDQFDPEYFFKVYHTSSTHGKEGAYCGLYSDHTQQPETEEINVDHPANVMADRQTLYCVPVPGETEWVKEVYLSQVHSAIGAGDTAVHNTSDLKRKYEEEEEEGGSNDMEVSSEGGRGEGRAKKHCSGPVEEQGKQQNHDLNFPLPDENGLPCMIKVYRDFEQFKVGCVVQVTGVLSVHPLLAPLTYSEDQHLDTVAERKAHCPPPALVPRLHAINIRLLPHSNPLLPPLSFPIQSSTIGALLTTEQTSSDPVEVCRAVLLDMLSQVLYGDRLAAEYTLLHLISYIYGRMEVIALGKYSLNLSGCDKEISRPLDQLLCTLLTKCFLLPLTLDNMNTWRFTPKKDYDSNRILASVLQLSPGTEVVVDETALTPGQLTPEGVANLTALGNVIQWQRLSYDFQFHKADFDCDLCVLILSEGKSILKADCHVPLLPADHTPPSFTPTPEVLSKVRQYLTLCRGLNYAMSAEMKSSLEEDFVRKRGSDPQLTGPHFHHLLCTARLLAISHGCSTLTPQHWAQACSMDKDRLHRIKVSSQQTIGKQ